MRCRYAKKANLSFKSCNPLTFEWFFKWGMMLCNYPKETRIEKPNFRYGLFFHQVQTNRLKMLYVKGEIMNRKA